MRERDDRGRIELRHLRYFLAVAEDRNISRAAARIGIAQPPLSQQIHQLENYLQCSLFVRGARGVELTPAGENFRAHAASILEGVDLAVDSAREVARGERGEFHLGAVYSALFLMVPQIVRIFEEVFPHATITVDEMSVDDQLRALNRGQLDAAIVRIPLSDPGLSAMPLLREQLVAAIPHGHPLANRKVVTLAEVTMETKVMPNAEGVLSFKQQANEIFRRHHLPRGPYKAPELNTLLGLVEAGLGPALVPRSASNLKYANIVFREISNSPPAFVLGAAWNNRIHSPMKEIFVRDVLPRVAREFLNETS